MEYFFMALMFSCALIRPFTLRSCAMAHAPHTTPAFMGVWTLGGALLMLPLCLPMAQEALPVLMDKPYLIAIGLSKGLILWLAIALGQAIRKHSNSTCEYKAPLSICILAIINFFQGEVLTPTQWGAVMCLAVLGFVFSMRGHMRTLSPKHKLMFWAIVLLGALPGACDQAVIPHTNWYTLFTLSAMGMLLTSLFSGLTKNEWRTILTGRENVIGGFVWVTTEVIVLFTLVTHLPVTVAAMSMALAMPTMMVISGTRWQEGNWKNQAAFGVLAYMAMVPMFLAH